MIVIDLSMLSSGRYQRCIYQLVNLVEIADMMGYKVRAVISPDQKEFKILSRISHLLHDNNASAYDGCEIYIAKSDTFFYDDNWSKIENLKAFKICLSSSDKLFRENRTIWYNRYGGPVQDRCDLYMPVNCSMALLKTHGHMTIPVAHRPSTQFFDMLVRRKLDHAFLIDDIQKIRSAFSYPIVGLAGFMGHKGYGERTDSQLIGMPDWVNFVWRFGASAEDYVKYLMSYVACIDLRGAGDKSLRFVEAVLLGRAIITKPQSTPYIPPLINGHNAVVVKNWCDLYQASLKRNCKNIVEQATADYCSSWSQLSQFKMMLRRAKWLT